MDGGVGHVLQAADHRLFLQVQAQQELPDLEEHDEEALHERDVQPSQRKAVCG